MYWPVNPPEIMTGNPTSLSKQAAPPFQVGDDAEDPLLRPVPSPGVGIVGGVGPRKKAAGVRTWLLLDHSGESRLLEAGKQAIMRRTGLPGRDLRILDPLFSYPSTVLGRERAIVINLEHIKAIITAQEVLLLNSRDPAVLPFVDELLTRLSKHHVATKSLEVGDWTKLRDLEDPRSRAKSGSDHSDNFPCQEDDNGDGPKLLPFEFVALEACIEAACSCLDNEARTLEREAHPALDKLTSQISTLNLERVRQIKSRLVAITGRVQKVRDELEHLLDDDGDMAEMYLTDKLQKQLDDDASVSSINNQDGISKKEVHLETDGRSPLMEEEEDDRSTASSKVESHSTSDSPTTKQFDVEELEMLLEAYFVQIEGTLNRLSNLREYVDDTEDYINIKLDDKQNNLLRMGVMLMTTTLVISAFVALVGLFGMNINIDIFNDQTNGMTRFLCTVGGGFAGTVLLYLSAFAWYKHRLLLE